MESQLDHELLIIFLPIRRLDSDNHWVLIDCLVELESFIEAVLMHQEAILLWRYHRLRSRIHILEWSSLHLRWGSILGILVIALSTRDCAILRGKLVELIAELMVLT